MLTIYGSDLSGPAIKVRLTASALNIDYQWRIVNLRDKEQKQEWFLKINPVGKIPAMDDNGFCLFESNAICRYLCDKQGSSLYPKELKDRAVIDQWIEYISNHISANASPIVFNRVFAPRTGRPINEKAVSDGEEFLKGYFPLIETQLSAHAYLVGGSLSLADIVLFAVLEPSEKAGIDLSAYPKLCAWRKALKGQPFYTKCYKEYGEMLKPLENKQ